MMALNYYYFQLFDGKWKGPSETEKNWGIYDAFKRLSSYSKHHPLYQALQEYGRAIKTIFILDYIDDVEMRQIIEVELSKVELANKFARAIRFGNNQEFNVETKDEQEIVEGCRRLIQNAIVCWNYLHLSEQIANAKTDGQRQDIIEKM